MDHFGIRSEEMIEQIEATGILPTEPFIYKFRAAAPRANQPGGKAPLVHLWDTAEYELYRVVSDRFLRDDKRDEAFMKLLFETRFLVFEFARKKNLPMKHFSLKPNSSLLEANRELWSFQQMILNDTDMFRSHMCHPNGIRARLYNSLSWKTVTFTILANIKSYIRNHEFFGTKTDSILHYVFCGPLSKKVLKGMLVFLYV